MRDFRPVGGRPNIDLDAASAVGENMRICVRGGFANELAGKEICVV